MSEPCSECGGNEWVGVEYAYGHAERYDGVSEWRCADCGSRFGRWSHRLLLDGDVEKRWGGQLSFSPAPVEGQANEAAWAYPESVMCPRCGGGGGDPGVLWLCRDCKGTGRLPALSRSPAPEQEKPNG